MPYVKLERGNDWGVSYYALPGKRLTEHGSADAKLGLVFREGQDLSVRWPDGSESIEFVKHHHHNTTVSDHGNSYPVAFDLAGFEVDCRGIKRWVALDEVEIWEI